MTVATETGYRLSTSLRTRPPEALDDLRAGLMQACGISRITEITRLDKVGLPVFVSVRPRAALMCVNAGKGGTTAEARASCLMEAVEFAVAERPARSVESLTPRAFHDRTGRSVLEYCPPLGAEIPKDEPIAWVPGVDILSNRETLSPLELVHLHPDRPAVFGADTTGLASGWTEDEAALHALLEIAERDTKSRVLLGAETVHVALDRLDDSLAALVSRIRGAGLQVALRYAEGAFALPWFQATIWDPSWPDPRFVNGGYGCHVCPTIAASRAVSEAVQSRLVYIHGGRDDLGEEWRSFAHLSESDRRAAAFDRIAAASGGKPDKPFQAIAGKQANRWHSIETALAHVKRCFQEAGLDQITRHDLTPSGFPVRIVRVVVPGAENFTSATKKLGHRLLAFARERDSVCAG